MAHFGGARLRDGEHAGGAGAAHELDDAFARRVPHVLAVHLEQLVLRQQLALTRPARRHAPVRSTQLLLDVYEYSTLPQYIRSPRRSPI